MGLFDTIDVDGNTVLLRGPPAGSSRSLDDGVEYEGLSGGNSKGDMGGGMGVDEGGSWDIGWGLVRGQVGSGRLRDKIRDGDEAALDSR